MKAIPRIMVRIDRGEDWVELVGSWQDEVVPICASGNPEDWCDVDELYKAWKIANKAVME